MRNEFAKVSKPADFVSCPGEEYHIIYSPIVKPDGTIVLEVSGKESIKDMINSQLAQTDMSWILKQLSLGNTSVLNQNTPMYGDFTNMPKSNAEFLQMYIDGENAFNKLDPEIRAKFDNDFMQWFATAGTNDWSEKMNLLRPDPEEAVEAEKE